MIPNAAPGFRQRLVLDTNICLDLFMFRDPRWQSLLDAMQNGHFEAVTSTDCRKEFELVLAYKKMNLSPEAQAQILAEFDGCIRPLELTTEAAAGVLPRCKDGDDQKFLEIARDADAAILITKDKALLKLGKKTAKLDYAALATIIEAASKAPDQAKEAAADKGTRAHG